MLCDNLMLTVRNEIFEAYNNMHIIIYNNNYRHCQRRLIVRGAGSMKRCGVRPSVPQQETRCCTFAAGGPAGVGDIDRLLQQRRANAGSDVLSAYVQAAEHRLVTVSIPEDLRLN